MSESAPGVDHIADDSAPDDSARSAQAIGSSAMRKASLRLLPLIALGYGVAFMDRTNISFASLQMNRDLHFSATVYGFGAGLFFISYAACEVPSNLLLVRFGARRWLARIMVTWGLIAVAMLFVRTPGQFYTMRFLLGMSEAGFFPGVIFYLATWFPAELRARAISRFYISLPISSAVTGIVAGALLKLNGRLGLAGWQWLFLIEGLPAVLLGIIFLIRLPDGPAQARWLTEDERRWIFRNVAQDPSAATHNNASILGVLTNRRVWEIGIFHMFLQITVYGSYLILPEFVQSITHLDVSRTGYLTGAVFLLGVPAMLLGAIHSDRAQRQLRLQNTTEDRYRHIVPWCLVMAAALAVCGLSVSPRVVIVAIACLFVAVYAIQGPYLSLWPSFFTGPSSAASIAAANTIGIIGGFLGPYWMGFAKDLTGDHRHGLITLSLPMLAGAGIMLYMRRQSGSGQVRTENSCLTKGETNARSADGTT